MAYTGFRNGVKNFHLPHFGAFEVKIHIFHGIKTHKTLITGIKWLSRKTDIFTCMPVLYYNG